MATGSGIRKGICLASPDPPWLARGVLQITEKDREVLQYLSDIKVEQLEGGEGEEEEEEEEDVSWRGGGAQMGSRRSS